MQYRGTVMHQGRLAWLGHCTRGPRARVSRTCRVLFICDDAGCALILHCEFEKDACKTASIIVHRQGYLHVYGIALCVPAGDVTDLSTPALLSQADFVPTVSAFNIGHCHTPIH